MTNNGNGLVELGIPSRLSWDAWCERARGVGVLKRKLPWYVGDLLLYGEEAFGEKSSQILREFGYEPEQLYNFKSIAKKFAPEERCDLPWSWHAAAASMPKKQRDAVLTRALAGEINRSGIRELALKSRSNGSGNGGRSTDEKTVAGLPDAKSVAANRFAEQIIEVGRFLRGSDNDEGFAEALDELIERALALRARLTTPTLGTK